MWWVGKSGVCLFSLVSCVEAAEAQPELETVGVLAQEVGQATGGVTGQAMLLDGEKARTVEQISVVWSLRAW